MFKSNYNIKLGYILGKMFIIFLNTAQHIQKSLC